MANSGKHYTYAPFNYQKMKMKDFYKKMSVVCFGLLAALSLAGCSSSSNDEEKSNKNDSEEDHIATSAEAHFRCNG